MSTEHQGDDVATTDPTIAALLRERAGYLTRKLPARVEAVDEQLALRGYTVGEEKAEGDEQGPDTAVTTPPAKTKAPTAAKQTR
jgi:hypothetical protein